MASYDTLGELLGATLENVKPPENYHSLRERLISIRPSREPPKIKESPENRQHIPGAKPG